MTFAQCDGTKEDLLKFLYTRIGILHYIIAMENHKDGGIHFHVYLELTKSCDIKCPRYFDWGKFHPKFEVAKCPGAVQRYCKKDGDYITNMKFGTAARANELARRGEIDDALRLISVEQPREVKDLDRWRKGFEILAKLSLNPTVRTGFLFHSLDGIEKWNRTKRTLVIWGPSCTGKTQYAKQLFKTPLLVRHMDKLKQFSIFKHDGIIFDDMTFSHIARVHCVHLLDLDEDSDINVKCSMVTIPAGVPRVITSNLKPDQLFNFGNTNYERISVMRRFRSIKVTKDLRKGAGLQCYFSDQRSESPAPDFFDSE